MKLLEVGPGPLNLVRKQENFGLTRLPAGLQTYLPHLASGDAYHMLDHDVDNNYRFIIEWTRDGLKRLGLDVHVYANLGKAQDMPYENASFDTVFMANVLSDHYGSSTTFHAVAEFFRRRLDLVRAIHDEIIAECTRVLRPEGTLVVEETAPICYETEWHATMTSLRADKRFERVPRKQVNDTERGIHIVTLKKRANP